MTRHQSISISARVGMALSSIGVASDCIDFSSRDTGGLGMSLELGRLSNFRGRCAVVSVGVCMVFDLQLIPRSNPIQSPDKDHHRSFISTRRSRCCSWACDGVGVTREGAHVQWCWYIGPLCRLSESLLTTGRGDSEGRADLVFISCGYDTYGSPSLTRLEDYPSANKTMMAGRCVMNLFQLAPIRRLEFSEIQI
jgi:hypothetical protein